jgi:hypothetical protein
VGVSPEKQPRIRYNWKDTVMTYISCGDWSWTTLAQDLCPDQGFGVRDVHIKSEHIFQYCDDSINVYFTHRGKFYLFVGIFPLPTLC